MFLFNWFEEGTEPKQGFNFYKLNDSSSFGVVIRNGLSVRWIRYSKKNKYWFYSYISSTSLKNMPLWIKPKSIINESII